ncbi:MAG TPA: alpha/beta hydrolase [Nitrosospira sp.]|jgi:phospholipase/carboxylesterase|nr:alpha/beta hydrolase [Nitrosospira sp.]
MTSISTDLLPAIEVETGKNPTHTVLWLHGLGAAGDDFVPIVNELALPASTRVRFLFPHAPMREVSINRGMLMRAWYDFDMVDPAVGLHENLASLRESQRAIEALIVREEQRGIPPGQIVLAGFSQGGALALQAGLRYGEKLAGIMALSAYLPAPQTLPAEANHANRSTPIFMAYGDSDNVIPPMLAVASKRQLSESGYAVEWHEYRMAHTVCREELDDIGAWLKKALI